MTGGNLLCFSEATNSPMFSPNRKQIACCYCCARRLWKSLKKYPVASADIALAGLTQTRTSIEQI